MPSRSRFRRLYAAAWLVFLGALAVVTLSAAQAVAQTAAVTSQSTKRLRANLQRAVPALMRKGEIPGLSIAVIRGGAVFWTGAYGVRSTETAVPVDSRTVFDAASLSKPVFAAAVLRMAERGELDLDDPLAAELPLTRAAHDPRAKNITARMVLSHSTGLPNWGGDRLDLAFDPGTGFNYSGEGYVYLAKVLERRTGTSLNDIVTREVFAPLGMTRSSYVSLDSLEANGAISHDEWGKPRPPRRVTEGNAAASLRTTAEDYAKFLVALLDGRVLQRATLERMIAPQTSASEWESTKERGADLRARISWGLGIGLQRGDFGTTLWHWGDNGDSKAYVSIDPVKRTGVVYFANGQTGLSIADALTALVLPERQWGIAWLDYEQYDLPRRVTRRGILRAFLEGEVAAGMQRYRQQRARDAGAVDLAMATDIGQRLLGQGKTPAAVALLTVVAEEHPDSAAAHLGLAEALLAAGEPRRALAGFERAAALDTANAAVKGRIAWARDALRVQEQPVTLTEETLRRYAGDYGPRRVTLEDGRLYYQRQGGQRYPLTALTEDTFSLDGLPTFRLRFVSDVEGMVTKVEGMYSDGRRDESARK